MLSEIRKRVIIYSLPVYLLFIFAAIGSGCVVLFAARTNSYRELQFSDIIRLYTDHTIMKDTEQLLARRIMVLIFLAMSIIFLVLAVTWTIAFATNRVKWQVEQFLQKNKEITMQQLEEEFAKAKFFKSNSWVSPMVTIFVEQGGKTHLLKNKDILWIYYVRGNSCGFRIWDSYGKKTSIPMYEASGREMLEQYQNVAPHILLGWEKQYEQLYKQNREELKKLGQIQAEMKNSENVKEK